MSRYGKRHLGISLDQPALLRTSSVISQTNNGGGCGGSGT